MNDDIKTLRAYQMTQELDGLELVDAMTHIFLSLPEASRTLTDLIDGEEYSIIIYPDKSVIAFRITFQDGESRLSGFIGYAVMKGEVIPQYILDNRDILGIFNFISINEKCDLHEAHITLQ